MAVARISKITLFFPAKYFTSVSEKLHQMGCVEIIPFTKEDASVKNLTSKEKTKILEQFLLKEDKIITKNDFLTASRELDRLHFAIETLQKSSELIRKLTGISTTRMVNTGKEENIDKKYRIAENLLLEQKYDYAGIIQVIENLWKGYLESEHTIGMYQKEAARLEPWISIPVELKKISDGEKIKITAAQISISKWDEFVSTVKNQTTTESDGELSSIIKIQDDGKEVSFGLVYVSAFADTIENILKKFGAVIVSYPDSAYTPKKMYAKYLKVLDIMKKRSIRRLHKISALADEHLGKLKLLYDYFLKIKTVASSERLMAGSELFRFFKGWIVDERLSELKKFLTVNNIPHYIIASEPLPSEKDDVPIVFKNKKPIEPFEVVTDLYGKPNYYEPDPTPWLAPFFSVFFGICMADAIYGLMILTSGIIGLLKLKTPSGQKFMKLVIYCGISTTIFGAIMGSYLGNIMDRFPLFSFFVPIKNNLTLFDPLKNSISFLGGCLVLGLIQTVLGSVIKLFTDIKDSSWRAVFLQDIPTIGIQMVFPVIVLVGVFGVKIISIKTLLYLMAVFSLMLMIYQWLVSDGIVLKLFQMFFSVYGAITGNALSDVLSYSRLFALGLSTSLLAMVLNEIASLGFSIPYVGYILGMAIIVFVHPFILAIGSLGAYVHTSRLQYLEFFNKFFQGGGREMRPLKFEKKYS